MKLLIWLSVFLWCLLGHGVSGVDKERVSVMERDSVTLNTGVQTSQQKIIIWYYNDIRIAEISGDQSKICTDDQCKERFRDRLELDRQTGSLTITNTRNTDAGVYTLWIMSSRFSEKFFIVSVTGASDVDPERVSVSVMEGDSVTLHTGVQPNQQNRVIWCYKGIRIAQISGDFSVICTDDQYNEGTERLRGRLKLERETGSLTITNTRNTDDGVYKLLISSSSSRVTEKIFDVSVIGASGVDKERVSVMERDSVRLHTGVQTSQQDTIIWYYYNIRIAEISGDQSQICTDDQCKERFRDSLKLDHQTGSLTITHTRNTDAGVYTLLVFSNRFSGKIFIVSVTAVPGPGSSPPDPDPGLSSATLVEIYAAVILTVAVLIYSLCKSKCTDPDSGLSPVDKGLKHVAFVAVWIYNLCTSKCTENGRRRGDHPQQNAAP